MSEFLDVTELVNIGIEDETSGVAFYQRLSEVADSGELRSVFADLAAQEGYHKRRFEEMLEMMGGLARQRQEQYPGEYIAYLRALTSGRAFPDAQDAVKQASRCRNDRERLELASRFEKDTLVLMNELGQLVDQHNAAIVRELAREERNHLITLEQARAALRT